MRISATGVSRRLARVAKRAARHRRTPAGSAERGFTLVELMVVMAIIGLATGAAVLTMPDARGDLRSDAERFAARVRSAQDAAVIEARDIALNVDARGYAFSRRERGQWVSLTEAPLSGSRWTDGAEATIGDGIAARVVFDTTGGVSAPIDVALARDAQRVGIHVDGDGTIDVR